VEGGVLESFRFDRYGDITPAKVTILRVTGRDKRLQIRTNDPAQAAAQSALVRDSHARSR
jgi:hypothetical protein